MYLNGRLDHLGIFGAEVAVLTGMWGESADAQAWLRDAEQALQIVLEDVEDRVKPRFGY